MEREKLQSAINWIRSVPEQDDLIAAIAAIVIEAAGKENKPVPSEIVEGTSCWFVNSIIVPMTTASLMAKKMIRVMSFDNEVGPCFISRDAT